MRGQQNSDTQQLSVGLSSRRGASSRSIIQKRKQVAFLKLEKEASYKADLFLEEIINHDYQDDLYLKYKEETNCRDYGCDNFCRCRTIHDAKIVGDRRGLFKPNNIKTNEIHLPLNSICQALELTYCKKEHDFVSQLKIEDKQEKQLMEGLLSSLSLIVSKNNVSIEIKPDYYGETIESVTADFSENENELKEIHETIKNFFISEDKKLFLLNHLQIKQEIIDRHDWEIEKMDLTKQNFVYSQKTENDLTKNNSLSAIITLNENNDFQVEKGSENIKNKLQELEKIWDNAQYRLQYEQELTKEQYLKERGSSQFVIIGIPKT